MKKSLAYCGHVGPEIGWKSPWHRHDKFHEMIVVIDGKIETRMDDQVLVGSKGYLLFYPCGRFHSERSLGKTPIETIFMAWTPMPNMDTSKWPMLVFDGNGRVRYLIRWMQRILAINPSQDYTILDNILRCILFEYGHSLLIPCSEVIQNLCQFINVNLSKKLDLENLAEEAGLSKYHLARKFTSETGQSPIAYIRHQRVEAARTLIMTTDLPLKSIAFKVGFADEYHLSKVFRKLTGQTPASFRRN